MWATYHNVYQVAFYSSPSLLLPDRLVYFWWYCCVLYTVVVVVSSVEVIGGDTGKMKYIKKIEAAIYRYVLVGMVVVVVVGVALVS